MALTEDQAKQIKGLSRTEAAEKLKNEGYNELPSSKRRNILAIAFEVVKEPMFLLLVACGSIYLFLGEPQDALLLLGFVFIMIGITVYQEGKTENALDALRDLSSPRALVIRDGERIRIAGREVVSGDMVCLCEGDRVPADGVIVWGRNLTVDEALLTGESISVRKTMSVGDPANLKMEKPGGDDIPYVYSGTLVVQGQGIALVKGTGIHTEIGTIGKALQTVVHEDTLLQKETARIVKAVFLIALLLFGIVVSGLRADARQLDGRCSRRHHLGHGHAARGISRRINYLPCSWRLADLAEKGIDAQDSRCGNLGGSHGALF